MRIIEPESYNGGRTLVQAEHPEVYEDLSAVLAGLDVATCLNPAAPFEQRRGGTPKAQKFGKHGLAPRPISQSLMNAQIERGLRQRGWGEQPLAALGQLQISGSPHKLPLLKGDFFKDGVFVEVEFGNDASFFRDLFKFQVAHRAGTAVAGVLVMATKRTCGLFDSGVTEYERVVGRLPYIHMSTAMPLWLIGIEPEDFAPVETRYIEMAATLDGNGITAVPWEKYQRPYLKT